MPTNHALRGIPVPAGARRVEPRYDPASLRVGLRVSALATGATLLVLTGAGLSRLRRRAE